MEKAQRAKLKAKLDMLRLAEVNRTTGKVNLPQDLLAGPLAGGKVYRLKIHGNVQLRPILSRGPVKTDVEWTVLLRAYEENRKTYPPDYVQIGNARYEDVRSNPLRRRALVVKL